MNWSSADSAMPAKATTSDMPDFVVPPSCGGWDVAGSVGSGVMRRHHPAAWRFHAPGPRPRRSAPSPAIAVPPGCAPGRATPDPSGAGAKDRAMRSVRPAWSFLLLLVLLLAHRPSPAILCMSYVIHPPRCSSVRRCHPASARARRRWTELPMPSDSRYLATVRRAMSKPLAWSSSTSVSSDRILAPSLAMSVRIALFTASADTASPPSAAAMPLVKKISARTARARS